ncbi:MAG TPA: flagellin, partial [Bacillota bacterium]|nr:flagellin [Bacillota bacterium]
SNKLILTTTGLGSDATLTVSSTDSDFLSSKLGLASAGEYITTKVGSDAVGTINGKAAIGKGNTLTLTNAGDDADGLTVNFDGSKLKLGTDGTLTFDAVINSDGQVTLQIGANDKQTLSFTINDMRSKALGIDKLDVTTPNGAAEAIKKLDNALTLVSAERSKLGAIQNRLEHTISNLGVAAENIAASESRIRDIDMAEEMTNFTKNQILVQASTAMLAQANQKSQAVLKLLG